MHLSPRFISSVSSGLRLRGGVLVAALLLLGAAGLRAQTPPPAVPVITTVAEYWDMSEADKQKPHPLRMDLIVYYYDAAWNLLYGQTGTVATYLNTSGRPFAIKSGQKVRLEGTVIPAKGINSETVKATVLAERQYPEAESIAGRVNRSDLLQGHWVALEGLVMAQREPDATHIELQVFADNQAVVVVLQINGTDPVPQLDGARIRVEGVYDALRDPSGRVERLQLWSAERDALQVLGWLADDDRFKLPRTPIDQLGSAGDGWVRVTGTAWAQEPGKSLTVRDGTGQIEVATAQPGLLAPNAPVEFVGRPVAQELGWTLRDPLFRAAGHESASRLQPLAGQAPQRLRLADQVLHLPPGEAEKRYPVALRGVITWFDERAPFFFVQDASGGVCVRREPAPNSVLTSGASVAVAGVTVLGAFAPEIEMSEVAALGSIALPTARAITLDQALTGAEEARRVEMHGYVRDIVAEGDWTRLDLVAPTGEFSAYLPAGEPVDGLRGATVRVRGVCAAVTDSRHEITGIRLWLQNHDAVVVDEPAAVDPFAPPLQTLTALRQFSPAQATIQRVRVSGVVLLHEPGRYLYLQNGASGLFVLSRDPQLALPGQWIEVAGLPGRAGNRLVLREAVWRPTSLVGAAVKPAELRGLRLLEPALDSQLAHVAATLRQAVREDQHVRLTLEGQGALFDATLPAPSNWVPPPVEAQLGVTGVYVLEYDEYRQPRGFRLELRGPVDVDVLAMPSWWTVRRTFYVVGLLAAGSIAILVWVVALRRRVRAQTEQIRQQLEKEARLQTEIERSSRLESLGVLAGGIAHDFNNLLTAILGNLGLAAMDKRVMAAAGDCISEAERGARRARDITHQLLTFAKGGEPVRTAVALPEIVHEAASFARHGTDVRLDIKCPPDLPPGNVDGGQISRVIQNLVTNAVQAMPDGGTVSIDLAAIDIAAGERPALQPGRYIRISVADTGHGIPPEIISRIFDPYFSTKSKTKNSGLGLATVHSIVQKHNGDIAVESCVGAGTTFLVWLPVATEAPPAPAETPRANATAPARILVMDDEAVVRRVAGRMLSLAGHEAVFAADGAEALRSYVSARQTGKPFDFVIFDLTVPGGMGGREALEEIQKVDIGARAIASSGYANDPILANPRAFGFRTSLPKPYDIPDLMRAIEEVRRV